MNAHLQPSGSACLLATETWSAGVKAAAVLLACVGLGVPLASAGERIALVGTSMTLVLSEGWVDSPGLSGKANPGGAALLMAHENLSDDDRLAAGRADPASLKEMVGEFGPVTVSQVDILTLGSREFLVQQQSQNLGDIKAASWAVSVGPTGRAGLVFLQNSEVAAPALDRQQVLDILSTVEVVGPWSTADGAFSRGFFVGFEPPFESGGSVGPDAALGWVSLRQADPTKAKVSFIFLPQRSDSLAESAKVETEGWRSEHEDPATMLGVAAIRTEGTYPSKSKGKLVKQISYTALFGGYEITLALAGSPDQFTPEVVAAFDKIAASVRQQNEADWAKAPENLK